MLSPKAPGRRKKDRAHPKRRAPVYAALDLGTNNCRLLIAEGHKDGFRVIDGYSRIVRLGEGVGASGRMSDAAIERALSALKDCKAVMDKHDVARSRCIATQACRMAENGRNFIERVREETGLDLKVIPAQEEAKLAVLGCHNLIDGDANLVLVVDIGGGSTELAWVDAKAARSLGVKGMLKSPPVLAWASFPLGVVTLSEAFPETDDPDWYATMKSHVLTTLWKFRKGRPFQDRFKDGEGHLIGTSGTVTSLAGVSLGLKKYNRAEVDGVWLTRSAAIEVTEGLRNQTPTARAKEPCIGPERADLVLAGCAILEAVWELWPSERLRVGDRGLREGLLLSMVHKSKRRRRRPAKTVGQTGEAGHGG